jgi:DNA repair exonuclease SbcCD ATPase subunit
MQKNGHDYMLTRYRGHPLLKNKVTFDGHGIPKTDEDSLIKDVQPLVDAFLGISPPVFLTTTFFSQRNFHVFHSLSDAGKKEWLEAITYGSLFPECEQLVREKVRTLERSLDFDTGKLRGLEESLTSIQESEHAKRMNIRLEVKGFLAELRKLRQQRVALLRGLAPLSSVASDVQRLELLRAEASATLELAEREMAKTLRMTGRCAACGAVISRQTIDDLQRRSSAAVATADAALQAVIKQFPSLYAAQEKRDRLHDALMRVARKKETMHHDLKLAKQALRDSRQPIVLAEDIQRLKAQILCSKKKLAYFKFWVYGFGLQGLRTYVLQTAANFLSARMQYYLQCLVSDRVSMDMEFVNNRIVFSFNNRSYGALSGGERQSVDLCTGFALRDVAEQYNKCRFNLLILDEPFEGLDDALTVAAQSLLLDNAKDSTFFITHRVTDARFDKLLSVEKDVISKLYRIYG